MSIRSKARFAAAFMCAATAAAQTFVVDAAGGPGSQFTEIATALAAVPNGAVLLVRPGSYVGFTVGQGVAILGDSPVTITGNVSIAHTQAAQSVTLRGLSWSSFPNNQAPLEVVACAGLVVLEELSLPPSPCVPLPLPPLCGRLPGFSATACQQLVIRNCSFWPVSLNTCNAFVEASTFQGHAASVVNPSTGQITGSTYGIAMVGGSLQIAGATVIAGGDGLSGSLISSPAAPGILAMTSAPIALRLLGGTVSGGWGGSLFGCCGAEAIRALPGGVLRLDPRVTLTSQQANPVTGLTVTSGPMPMVTATSATAGSALQATVATEAGDLAVLVLGLPGAPASVPPFADPFWLQPTAFQFMAFGVQQPAAPISSTVTVPLTPSFAGLRVAWQAVATGPNTGEQASNPSIALVW